jgi:hypothetical protein
VISGIKFDKEKVLSNIRLMVRIIKMCFILFAFLIIDSCSEQEYDYPLVFTGDVTNITDAGATFNGKISSLGKSKPIESGFIWSLYHNDNYGIKVSNSSTTTGVYSLNTNETLFPGKTYYVRAYVQNEKFTTYGRELSFKIPEKEVDPGHWTKILNYLSPTDWSEGCDIILSCFTVNDSTFTILSDGKVYCYIASSNSLVYLTQTNTLKPDFHFTTVYNDKAYIFENSFFYRFDPKTFLFTQLSNSGQLNVPDLASGFLSDDNIYVGIGNLHDYWKYNITTDSWYQVHSFPQLNTFSSYSFSTGQTGYVGTYTDAQAWIYDTEGDSWIKKVNTPFVTSYNRDCLSLDDKGFCFYYRTLYKYYPKFDYWETLARMDDPDEYICYPKLFTVGGKIYLVNVWNTQNTDHYNIWLYEK